MASSKLDNYHIGIICALNIELAAVRANLDKDDGMLMNKDPQDPNVYFTGEIHQHRVVVAALSAGVDGVAAAADVASNMTRTFRQLRYGLLVGIGGGIPDLKAGVDIRLGDVVVSEPRNTHGGVVQYDKGKYVNDHFERKGMLRPPPIALLNALQALQAEHELTDSKIPQYLAQMIHKYPKTNSNYTYPGIDKDILHTDEDDQVKESVCQRKLRPNTDPHIHYGTIVSGNQVIKDALKRDGLRRDYGALCVEMEAAGLMNSFPCLVIRGICDYADRHKNDQWQRYAAATAASFAKELLLYVSMQTTTQETPVQELLEKIDRHVQQQVEYNKQQHQFNERQENRWQNKQFQECLHIFKLGDYESGKNVNPNAAQGTCRWVLCHNQYQQWYHSRGNDLLWISADPGCGKSVLSRFLVDSYSRISNTYMCLPQDAGTTSSLKSLPHTVCYFFFKDGHEEQNNLAAALCALLHQLFSHQPGLISHALPSYEKSGDKLHKEVHELWRILKSAASDEAAQPVTCIIDALDECLFSDRHQLVGFLRDFYLAASTEPCGQLKWLITSRPYDDIEDAFGKIPSDMPSIRLRGEGETDLIGKEIKLVILERVRELSRELKLTTTKTQEITDQLLSIEHRTYLWLYLAIDEIKRSFRKALRECEKVVLLVPQSVEDAYEKILQRTTDETEQRHARKILAIIVGARRPLTIGEMALALEVAALPSPLSTTEDLILGTDQLGNNIRRWCGLFVVIIGGRLHLLHQTAKEFLLTRDEVGPNAGVWKHCLRHLDVEINMARICVFFLCLVRFNEAHPWYHSRQRDDGTLSVRETFFAFAVEHWADHVQKTELHLDNSTWEAVRMLYDESAYSFFYRAAHRVKNRATHDYAFDLLLSVRLTSNLQVAASYGHDRMVREILDATPDKLDDSGTIIGETVLVVALESGHLTVAQTLLDKGADIHDCGEGALVAASGCGYTQMVQTLLDMGAEVNEEGYGELAIAAASKHGHVEVVSTLLDEGADIDAASEDGENALTAAASGGHLELVQLLLARGADVNSPNGSALHQASRENHHSVVLTLLEDGADFNAIYSNWGTALQTASTYGHYAVVRHLLRYKADVNIQFRDAYGCHNALQAASQNGHSEVFLLLLQHGAIGTCVGNVECSSSCPQDENIDIAITQD